MTLRNRKRLMMLVAILLSPLFLLTVLVGSSVVNPMGLVFLTTFEVENKTSEEILVTPIGAVGPTGDRHTLPYSALSWLYIMKSSSSDYSIASGEVRKFTYDWDDIQFSEILVRQPSKDYRVIPTGLHPTKGQYRRPEKTRFEIADIESAQLAEEKHLAALHDGSSGILTIYLLAALGIASPVLFIRASRMKIEAEQVAATEADKPRR